MAKRYLFVRVPYSVYEDRLINDKTVIGKMHNKKERTVTLGVPVGSSFLKDTSVYEPLWRLVDKTKSSSINAPRTPIIKKNNNINKDAVVVEATLKILRDKADKNKLSSTNTTEETKETKRLKLKPVGKNLIYFCDNGGFFAKVWHNMTKDGVKFLVVDMGFSYIKSKKVTFSMVENEEFNSELIYKNTNLADKFVCFALENYRVFS